MFAHLVTFVPRDLCRYFMTSSQYVVLNEDIVRETICTPSQIYMYTCMILDFD